LSPRWVLSFILGRHMRQLATEVRQSDLGLKTFFDEVRPRSAVIPRNSSRASHQALHIFLQEHRIRCYGVTDFEGRPDSCARADEGNDPQVSTMPSVPPCDREADAVECDRAFHRYVAAEFGLGCLRRTTSLRLRIRGARARPAPSTWPLHEVAQAEFTFIAVRRAFEIDARAGLHFAEAGASQRFAGEIGGRK